MTFHVADSSAAVNKNMFLLRYKHNELDLLMIITIQLKFFLTLRVSVDERQIKMSAVEGWS